MNCVRSGEAKDKRGLLVNKKQVIPNIDRSCLSEEGDIASRRELKIKKPLYHFVSSTTKYLMIVVGVAYVEE